MRVTVSLTGEEYDRLKRVAQAERRTLRDQAAVAIVCWLDDADSGTPATVGGEDPEQSEEGRAGGSAS